MSYARRTDGNLTEIVNAARKLGFRIYVRNDELGDLDAQLGDRTEVWECKTRKGKYTKKQKEYRAKGWIIPTVITVEDLLLARERMRS